MLKITGKYGMALEYVSESLQNDKDIVI
ncbi:MAG: DUF4116 domain-containing protein [bacterium]